MYSVSGHLLYRLFISSNLGMISTISGRYTLLYMSFPPPQWSVCSLKEQAIFLIAIPTPRYFFSSTAASCCLDHVAVSISIRCPPPSLSLTTRAHLSIFRSVFSFLSLANFLFFSDRSAEQPARRQPDGGRLHPVVSHRKMVGSLQKPARCGPAVVVVFERHVDEAA